MSGTQSVDESIDSLDGCRDASRMDVPMRAINPYTDNHFYEHVIVG